MSTDLIQIDPREPQERGLVRLVDTPENIRGAWDSFQALKLSLLEANDYQEIQGRRALKKSGYRKLAAAFGVSLERLTEEREQISNDAWLWRFVVRATAPNGRYCDGVAICASNERRMSHPEHDTYSTAYTRAANRAIADLIGGGEVSAEELGEPEVRRPAPRQQAPVLTPRRAEVIPVNPGGPATEQQQAAIRGLLVRTGKDPGELAAEVGVARLEDLTVELARDAIRRLQSER